MHLLANLEIAIQIIEKNGTFYGQVFDTNSMNLVFETGALARSGCAALLGTWVAESLLTPPTK